LDDPKSRITRNPQTTDRKQSRFEEKVLAGERKATLNGRAIKARPRIYTGIFFFMIYRANDRMLSSNFLFLADRYTDNKKTAD